MHYQTARQIVTFSTQSKYSAASNPLYPSAALTSLIARFSKF
ncbi:hypothetical protein Hdeb2414_s0005g00183241 [Helianthus debilis subsp. tardiflorus]